jgi:putative molybdopterin biosynthesis protein
MPDAPKARNAASSKRLHIRLGYSFADDAQRGADLDQPVFAVLQAVHDSGSIKHAAQALGRSYRYVWGVLRDWEQVIGEPLVVWSQGNRARLTEFGQRLLWAELRARKRMQAHVEVLRTELEHMIDEARDHGRLLLTLCASHDLALPLLRDHAMRHGALHVDLRVQGSLDAVRSLNAGRCLAAGFHVPATRGASPVFAKALKPMLKPGVHKLIGCLRRTQGLMMRREHADTVIGVAELARSPLRFVNRQVGSGTRLLMDHLLQQHRVPPRDVAGYDSVVEESHVAVASCIVSGVADVGLGVEAAALEFGLHFKPIVEEDYFIVCLKEHLEHPAMLRLRSLLASDAWKRLVDSLPGYQQAAAPGQVLMMTEALPWWRYAVPKRGRAARRKAQGSAAAVD